VSAPGGSASAVVAELTRLLEGYVALHAGDGLPRQPHDPQWPSPCQEGPPGDDGSIAWRPVPRVRPPDWSGLEAALEQALHPDLAAFYGAFWSDCIPVRAEEGGATLIQVWNERDFDRLIENLLGHALQKRRRRDPLSLFVACTDEGDLVLSVDNASGRVVLEQPGQPPQREVADSLAALLARMQPATNAAAGG
jgi:SecY interacting protein Syd